MGNFEAAVDGALERAEDLGAGRRAREANVEDARERPLLSLVLDKEVLAVNVSLALVVLVHPELGEQAARAEQPSRVARSVVRQPDLDAVLFELVRVGGRHANVAGDLGIDHLADDILKG